jgi:hypothetical protein
MGAKTWTEIPGKQASVRLGAREPQTFVVGVAGPLPDPLPMNIQYATLIKLDVDKKSGTRQLVHYNDSAVFGIGPKAKVNSDAHGIPLNFARRDAQSITVEPRSALLPGEYAFFTMTQSEDPYAKGPQSLFHCFGVD